MKPSMVPSASPPAQPPGRAAGLGVLLCGQMCVGAAGVFGTMTVGGVRGLTACALRMGLAALVVAVVNAWRPRPRLTWQDSARLAAAGALLAAHFGLWIGSLASLPVAVSSLLVATSPLWNELWAVAGLRRRPRPGFLAVLVVTSLGAGLMLGGPECVTGAGGAAAGALLGLASGAAQAATLLCVEAFHTGRRAAGLGPVEVWPVVTTTYGWSAALLAVAAWLDGGALPALTSRRTWLGILAMAIISQVIGHTLVNRAVARFPAQLVILTALVRPAFAALLAAATLGERLSTRGGVGAVLVAVGIAGALTMATSQSAPADAPPNAGGGANVW